jgi:hypothetical protein
VFVSGLSLLQLHLSLEEITAMRRKPWCIRIIQTAHIPGKRSGYRYDDDGAGFLSIALWTLSVANAKNFGNSRSCYVLDDNIDVRYLMILMHLMLGLFNPIPLSASGVLRIS